MEDWRSPIANYFGGSVPEGIGRGTNSTSSDQLKALQDQIAQLTAYSATPFNNDPFTVARSGLQSGGLQDYINKLTGQASNSLNGGLLGYQPSNLMAGSAGGTPQSFQAPSFPGLLGQGFAQRPWMVNRG